MEKIQLAENLVRFRKEKKITQEQLAVFCGVTKASVSKWETAQTFPDILLLPRLAAYFGVSIDMLMGYEMQLSAEQIQEIYIDLAAGFAEKEYEEAMTQCREYAKQYYSCHELLEKIVILWISHENLAGEKREELLREAKELCGHILKNSKNIRLCSDVVFLQAIADLLLGHPEAAVEALEEMSDPCRFSIQNEEVLMSAYIALDLLEKGNDFAQISMYLHVLMLISDACRFLILCRDDLKKCEETERRIGAVIRLYNIEEINFHYVSLFWYQMAEIYCQHGEKKKAVNQLMEYVRLFERYLCGEIDYLQSDDYLDRLHIWFEKSSLAGSFPRSRKAVYDGMILALNAPVFDSLKEEAAFAELMRKAESIRGHVYVD